MPTPLLPLRDQLALDRTELANRRTWMAYVRTALAMFVSGVSFLQFFELGWTLATGWGLVALSPPILALGYVRYRQQLKQLRQLEQEARVALTDAPS